MLRFLVHRLIGLAVTMFFVSIMVFVIMELPPGDYADRYAFRKFSGTGVNVTEGDIENIRIQFGLDKPAWQRYFQWVGGIVTRFDFGQSFAFETSVNNVIGKRLWMTLAILYSTLVLTYLLAIPIAIYAAIHRRSAVDYSLTVLSYLGLALPNFLLALILLYISVTLFGTSIGGLFSPEYEKAGWSVGKALDLLQHLIVPAIVLAGRPPPCNCRRCGQPCSMSSTNSQLPPPAPVVFQSGNCCLSIRRGWRSIRWSPPSVLM
jgi:peptide/nickel transport system permease protein